MFSEFIAQFQNAIASIWSAADNDVVQAQALRDANAAVLAQLRSITMPTANNQKNYDIHLQCIQQFRKSVDAYNQMMMFLSTAGEQTQIDFLGYENGEMVSTIVR